MDFPIRIPLTWASALLFVLAVAGASSAAAGTSKEELYGQYGGPFALVDHHGRGVTDTDFKGRYMLVFFGYTYCPDVCPTDLRIIGDAMDMLGDAGESVQPLFITIDPERDTPEVLADFVANFHPRLLGLTGSKQQIASIANDYGVTFFKVFFPPSVSVSDDQSENTSDDDNAAYLVNHSAATYLMGPDGKFITYFPHATTPENMARQIHRIMGRP